MVILGFDHDDLASGGGKAGITLGTKNSLATSYAMNSASKTYDGKGNLMKLIVTTIEFLRLITYIIVTNNVAKEWVGNPVPTSIERMLCLI